MTYKITRDGVGWVLWSVVGTSATKLNTYKSRGRAIIAARLLAGHSGKIEVVK